MKRSLFVWVCLVALTAVAAYAHGDRSRDLSESYPLAAGQSVRLDFPVGELRVEAISGDSVRVELTARCKWGHNCEGSLDDVRIESHSSKRRLEVDVDAPRPWRKLRLELDGTIQVPKGAALTIDMGIGELRVEGFESDLRVDLGIGEVTVRVPEAAVDTLSVDAGIGDASVHGASQRVSGRRSKLIGSEVYWDDGEGDSRVTVEVGIGEASVWMDGQ